MTTELQNRIPVGDDARQLAMYLLDTYFKTQPYVFTKHHLDSYDQFLSRDLSAMIRAQNPILILKDKIPNTDDYRYKVEIFIGGEDGSNIEIGSPTVSLQNTEEVRLLFPNEARLRNLTYSSLVLADVVCKISITTQTQQGLMDVQIHERTFAKFPLFRIPIMLHSRYCNLHGKSAEFLEEAGEDPQDNGGYFIVDGSEKVLMTKQEQAFNTLYINTQERDPKVTHFASISCLSPITRQVKRISFYFLREFETIIRRQYATLQVGLPFVRKPVPIFILFRALGYQTDEEIIRLILPDPASPETKLLEPYLITSINEAYPFLDTYSAIQYIKTLTKGFSEAHVLDVLVNQFFIHIDDSQQAARVAFLGDCVRRILRVVAGLDLKTDKDDIRNQRCLVSGFSTQMLFSGIYNGWIKAVALAIDTQYNYNEKIYSGINFLNIFAPGNTNLIFKPLIITDGIMRAFKGQWGSGLGEDKAGLIQQLSRQSYLDFMSSCRRVVLDFDTGMKLTGPRHLHPSQFGYFCTSEVPSGASIGITKNLSMMTTISTASDPTVIAQFLFSRGWIIPCAIVIDEQRSSFVPFFLNGGLLGYCSEPVKVAKALQFMKRTGCIAPMSSVGFNIRDRNVFLYVDEGRPLRPLIFLERSGEFPLQRMKELKSWRELVCGSLRDGVQLASTDFVDPFADVPGNNKTPDAYIEFLSPKAGVIEYIDPYEHNQTYIATFPDNIMPETTHVEIHPSTILSILTGIIPFPNHNQSPRNQLGDSQSKQGLSVYATNFDNRFDNMAHVLCYGEAPLVRTIYYDYIGNGKMSYGENCILAIAAFTGYNQEDGIIMNYDSVQRGLFRSMAFRSYEAFEEDDAISKAKTRIGNPTQITAWTDIKPGVDYSKLDDSGIVKLGEYVDETTVICGKYIQLPSGQISDASVTGQVWTRGRVEKIAVTISPTGLRLVKIRVVQDRTPELGDKFSNRHGQKGTIGMLVRAHDMPRSSQGITPDFIMNPHAIPSRMTIGQLLENLLGKSVANIGAIGNGTAFMNQGSPHGDIGAQLEQLGFEKYGNEILYNGQTGEQIPSAIFMAPVFAMRLKHMTEDKWNARGEGRREQLTHQPTGGRGNQGGLRIGEMESGAITAHGLSAFTKESFMKRSDGTTFIVCEGCGTIPIYNERQGLYLCPMCDGPIQFAGESTSSLELIPPTKRTKAQFTRIEMPYATALLNKELESYMNISMRYLTEKSLRHLKKIVTGERQKVDITLVNAPLPVRKVPEYIAPSVTTIPIPQEQEVLQSESSNETNPTNKAPVINAIAVQQESITENLSGLPHIPSVLESIKPLEEILMDQGNLPEQPQQPQPQQPQPQPQQPQPQPQQPQGTVMQEVKLVIPQQFAQPQTQPSLTQELIASTIGQPPATQAPPAQVLMSPSAVTPVIMVDTTAPAMIQEGLPTMMPQQQQAPRQTVKLKRPATQQGGEDEQAPRSYGQPVQFLRL